MTIYIHEWKQNQKSLWIWTLSVAVMNILCMMLYPQMRKQADSVSEMFSQMGGFSSAFGMDQVNFGDALGFFAIECGNILALGGVMFAALLGIGMLFYFLNLFGNISDQAEWVKYVTPFAYADASTIIAENALDTKLLCIGAGYLAVGVVIAFWHYSRKDIA